MQTKKIKSVGVIHAGSAPDIDTDIHTEGRMDVVQHVSDAYGEKNVANIITFGKFKSKNSLKSMATIFEIPFAEANKVAQLIPAPIDGKECTLQDIFDPSSPRYAEGEDFRRATDNEKWKKVIEYAMPLAGRIRETGVHACFEPSTLVRTENGYKQIKDVVGGDKVLTHNNRYMEVADQIITRSNDNRYIDGENFIPIETTNNHPFYVRSLDNNNQYGEPHWVTADELSLLDLVGTPVNNAHEMTSLGHGLNGQSPEVWKMIGSHLAKSNMAEVDTYLRTNLPGEHVTEVSEYINTLKNSDRILNLPAHLLMNYLQGYFAQQEQVFHNRITDEEITLTISDKEDVLFTIKAINKVYHTTVDVRNAANGGYLLTALLHEENNEYGFFDVDRSYIWSHIRHIANLTEPKDMYNLSVYDDNSYTVNNISVHNCGVIISNKALSETIPTQVRQNDGALITQWTYPQCEALGLIKMDFLGLDTLDIIQNTLNNIRLSGKEVPDMTEIIQGPMDDPKTYKLLQNAETTGIFQLGSPGMRELLKRVKPTEFEDLAAVTALYRPGPMKMNSHIEYADRKNGREDIEYIDPEFEGGPVEEVLKSTYGLCLPEDTPIYDGTQRKFVKIKDLNPMTSTTPSINLDTNMIELKPVNHVIQTGIKEILEITRADGVKLKASTTHPILTQRGYVKAKFLTTDDMIAINRQHYPLADGQPGYDKDKERILNFWKDNGSKYDANHNAVIKIASSDLANLKKSLNVLGFKYYVHSFFKTSYKVLVFNDDFATLLNDKVVDENTEADIETIEYVKINAIKSVADEICYDIEVEDNHNFLVDNAIVHNCIYQEQCMQLAQRAAGFSSYKADVMRKAMGKKKEKVMKELRPEFIEGVVKNGYSEAAATKLWDTIKQFAQYGFNKSHSMSYGINAYQTCYLKANYPVEFMSSLIQQATGDPDKVMSFLQEASRMKLKIGPVSVNESQVNVAPVDHKSDFDILYGFSGVKHVSNELAQTIIDNRKSNGKFKSVGDFVSRIAPLTNMNSQSLKFLSLSGAFDAFDNCTRRGVVEKASSLIKSTHKDKVQKKSLFDLTPETDNLIESIKVDDKEYPYNELIKLEADCIGIFISGTPTQRLGKLTHTYNPTPISKINSGEVNGQVNVLGTFTLINSKTKKNGTHSMGVRIDDGTGYMDVYLPNPLVNSIDKGEEMLRRFELKKKGKEVKPGTSKRAIKLQELIDDDTVKPIRPITLNEPFAIQLSIREYKGGTRRIFVSNIQPLVTAYDGSLPLNIKIPTSVDVRAVNQVINKYPGDTYVRANVEGRGWNFFNTQFKLTQDSMQELESVLGARNILTKGV